jgi:hypothetical protein
MLRKNKDVHIFVSDAKHSPTAEEVADAYVDIFSFLDNL